MNYQSRIEKTKREYEINERDIKITRLLAEGKTYKEIGREIGAKQTEVMFFLWRMRLGLNAVNTVQLVYKLSKSGVI